MHFHAYYRIRVEFCLCNMLCFIGVIQWTFGNWTCWEAPYKNKVVIASDVTGNSGRLQNDSRLRAKGSLLLTSLKTHKGNVFPRTPASWPVFWSRADSQLHTSLLTKWQCHQELPALPNGTCDRGCWGSPALSQCCFAEAEGPFVFPENEVTT